MKKKYLFVELLLAMMIFLAIIIVNIKKNTSSNGMEASENMKVVASFYPVYIAADNVIADIEGVELTSLTQPTTGCLHDYQLSPQDLVNLSNADVLIVNGGGIEQFLGDVIAQYPGLTIITASEGAEFLCGDMENHNHDEEESHNHEMNGHIWMNIELYQGETEHIAAELSRLDPAHEKEYQSNADRYLTQLDELKQAAAEIAALAGGGKVVLFHEAFAYLADELGMETVYTMELEEDTALSAGETGSLISMIWEENAEFIFVEARYGTKIGETIASETKASVYVLDPLITGDGSRDSYIKNMRKNYSILKEALKR